MSGDVQRAQGWDGLGICNGLGITGDSGGSSDTLPLTLPDFT